MGKLDTVGLGREGGGVSAPVTIKTRKESASSAERYRPVTLSEELIRSSSRDAKWKIVVRGTTMWV